MSVMLNRLKNALAGDDASNYSANNRQPRGRLRGPGGGGGPRGDARHTDGDCRLPYSRPHFLHLSVDEVAASADKTSRPIILPRDVTKVPWCAGYAEVINAGKSEVNEDQARAERIILKNCASNSSELIKLNNAESLNEITLQDKLEIEDNFIVPDCLDRPEKESEVETVGPAIDANLSDKIKVSEESELSDVEKEVVDGGDKIQNEINFRNKSEVIEDEEDMSSRSEEEKYQVLLEDKQITMTYFGIFDGHAGYGAAVIAAASLHYIITDNLLSIIDLLTSKKAKGSSQSTLESLNSNDVGLNSCCVCQCHRHQMMQKSSAPVDINDMGGPMPIVDKTSDISIEELVIGAIEKSFQEMDHTIDSARVRFNDSLGGCTALAAIFFMGKLFIANAGDCRAVICHNGKAVPASFDFTPETERKRIYTLASLFPQLLHNEFRVREFVRRPTRKDIGKKLLCREAWMSGWSLNTVKSDDLKVPVITGEGKRVLLEGKPVFVELPAEKRDSGDLSGFVY